MYPPPARPPPPAAVDPYYGYPQYPPPPVVPHHNPKWQHITTLFVAGLPSDVKPREIHNLFRNRPGFDFCQLEYTGRGDQVVAFVNFFTHETAMAALSSLNGSLFDPETQAVLHIELARSNSRKRSNGTGVYCVIDKRAKREDNNANVEGNDDGNDDDGLKNENDVWDSGSDEPSDTENEKSGKKHAVATNKSRGSGVKKEGQASLKDQSENSPSAAIPPCSTLFLANLGPTCTEQELQEAFSKFPGFNLLKMRARGGLPVAFVDFEDIESSTAAMEALQGTLLPSSDRGGLHLEYARSKMRKT